MAKIVAEDTKLIDTFISVNEPAPATTTSRGVRGFLKTIGATFWGASTTARIVSNDDGYSKLSDILELDGESSNTFGEDVSIYRTIANDRYRQYAAYDSMAEDTIISSALDLYADDATQTDALNRQLWISGENQKDVDIVDGILKGFDITTDLWKIARLLAKYGDVYIELFYNESAPRAKAKLVESKEVVKNCRILNGGTHNLTEAVSVNVAVKQSKPSNGYVVSEYRIVPDIENIFDLRQNGKTVAFAKLPNMNADRYGANRLNVVNNDADITYYPADKFIHFYIDEADSRNIDTFSVSVGGDGGAIQFEIKRGKSMIHDVYRALREMQLIEYSILMSRVTRSSVFRFVKVQVGQMSKGNVDINLRKIKNLIENKTVMNTADGTFKPYSDPGPMENYLYLPVRDGVGDVSVDTISSGDVNIKDIADLEHYRDKVFAGLKIPKGMLNFDETTGALFNSGGTLTKQDERYARTIKRLQVFLKRGFTNLLDVVLRNRGLSYIIDNYDVNLVAPATSEDDDRIEQIQNKITLAQNMMSLIGDLSNTPNVTLDVQEYIDYITNDILNDSKLAGILKVGEAVAEGESEEEEPVDLGGERAEFQLTNEPMSAPMASEPEETETFGEVPTVGAEEEIATEEPETGLYGGEWAELT